MKHLMRLLLMSLFLLPACRAVPTLSETEEVEIYTAVIEQIYTQDDTYGGTFNAPEIYFINNDGEGMIKAKGIVRSLFNSEKMTPEASKALVSTNQPQLQLTAKQTKRWAVKRYIVLIEVEEVQSIEPFRIDKRCYGNMDDWLPLHEDIRFQTQLNI